MSDDSLTNFFWPTYADPDPSGINRFGRVLHWTATGIAALIAIAAGAGFLSERSTTSEYGPDYSLPILGIVAALVAFFGGRAARYIFSGE